RRPRLRPAVGCIYSIFLHIGGFGRAAEFVYPTGHGSSRARAGVWVSKIRFLFLERAEPETGFLVVRSGTARKGLRWLNRERPTSVDSQPRCRLREPPRTSARRRVRTRGGGRRGGRAGGRWL